MKTIYIYLLLRTITRDPLLTIFILLIIYLAADRAYIGLLPDFLKPLRGTLRIRDLKRQIKEYPYNGNLYFEAGQLLVEKGKYDEGASYLEKANEMIPQHPDIVFFLSVAKIESNNERNREQGIPLLNHALEVASKTKTGEIYFHLIKNHIQSQGYDQEVENYLGKMRNYSTPEQYYKLSKAFLKIGNKTKAKEMLLEVNRNYQQWPSFMKKKHRTWVFQAKLLNLFI